MTKNQAIKRVTKLRTLASGTSNPHERDAALRQALSLMKEHHLREDDLASPKKVSNFDKLVDVIGDYAAKHPELKNTHGASKIIVEILAQSKKTMSSEQKIKLLNRLSQVLRITRLVVGDSNSTLNDVIQIFEEVTKTTNP